MYIGFHGWCHFYYFILILVLRLSWLFVSSAAVKKATPAAAKVALQKKLANVSIARYLPIIAYCYFVLFYYISSMIWIKLMCLHSEMPPFPHLLPNGLCLLSLGSIVPLHAFHDVSYIHPLGYHATRLLPSIGIYVLKSCFKWDYCLFVLWLRYLFETFILQMILLRCPTIISRSVYVALVICENLHTRFHEKTHLGRLLRPLRLSKHGRCVA